MFNYIDFIVLELIYLYCNLMKLFLDFGVFEVYFIFIGLDVELYNFEN